ncbi:50S ribosomal protein L25/general stress protein Ctc [Enterococcus sp. HY326]|uniref:50S ribosomal protein L25/general stress protein Ctc n=1 Tax=Enterococcus sp. HY326 TaxID=2971265 RepID=UPI0022409B7D|nr:50S ribosomal protein L25/general stress protein Ctc [Enterococcus sp. HY326]
MSVSLEVQERAVRPRSERNRLRHEGRIPAVVYGYQIESTPISVDSANLEKLLRQNGANAVFEMNVKGQKVNSLVHSTQLDTFNGKIKHVEFLAVNMKEETEVEAEVSLIGEAAGVKAGGTLAQNLYTVVVSATPDKLPERVEVDVTALEIGDSISVADLPKHADYTVVTPAEEQIAAVVETIVNDEPETTEAAAEPEVIGEDAE